LRLFERLAHRPNGHAFHTAIEACVFRRLPAGGIFEALGLWSVLDSEPIAPHEIPAFRPAASIPLDDLGSRAAGEFEADFGILSWRPPPRIYPAGAEVKLLDLDLRPSARDSVVLRIRKFPVSAPTHWHLLK
jgi:hypothetical protein